MGNLVAWLRPLGAKARGHARGQLDEFMRDEKAAS
jgi:hypothetical protein